MSKPDVILKQIGAFYDELAKGTTDPKLNVHDLSYVMAVMARWEGIRDEVARETFHLKQQHLRAKMAFDNGMREAMATPSRLTSASAYEERKAIYETKHMTALTLAAALEFVVDALRDLHWHVDKKIQWLKGLQIEARELDKRAFYQSSKDVFTVD